MWSNVTDYADSIAAITAPQAGLPTQVGIIRTSAYCALCRCRHKAHSIRGFISGSLGKKMGITVESFKRTDGVRAYRAGTE